MSVGKIIALVFLIIAFLALPIGIITAIRYEKKEFNNGYCPRCGERLRHADTDSQGGRLYTCDKCGKYSTWISYPCVDKAYRKEEIRKYYAEDEYGDRYGNKLN